MTATRIPRRAAVSLRATGVLFLGKGGAPFLLSTSEDDFNFLARLLLALFCRLAFNLDASNKFFDGSHFRHSPIVLDLIDVRSDCLLNGRSDCR